LTTAKATGLILLLGVTSDGQVWHTTVRTKDAAIYRYNYHLLYRFKSVLMYRYIQRQAGLIYCVSRYIDVSWLVLMVYKQIIVHYGQPKWYIMLLKEIKQHRTMS